MSAPQNLSFVLNGPLKVTFEDRPIPRIQNDRDVLVQVKFTGICGSDVHYWQHGRIGPFILTSPMVLGHESSGIVIETGSSVTTLKPGDKVSLEPGIPCRHCKNCKNGKYNLCPSIKFAATPPYDGTLAKYYVLPEDFCHLLPVTVSLEEGAVVEPLSVAVHIINKQANVKPFDSVVVFGAGPIGLLCAAVAKAFGAHKIIVVDINPDRISFAQQYVAVDAFNTALEVPSTEATEIAKEIIKKYGLEPGADVAIDASGAESAIQSAIHVLRNGGTFVQAGMGKSEATFPITEMCCKELNVKGSFRYGPGDYKMAIDLIESGKVNVKKLITKTFRFETAEEALKAVRDGKEVKVIIEGQ